MNVLIDNAKYHHARLHRQWREQRCTKFHLHFLPPYSPDLNPIERVCSLVAPCQPAQSPPA
ncbi:MAG TPA: transposase, partial [Candidatus Paceibacterota bacterium]|nr:transposase [Verrucomicrobiota bacterium]HRZ47666.1 transposase [Candidatus Paceibacterota bacterium]